MKDDLYNDGKFWYIKLGDGRTCLYIPAEIDIQTVEDVAWKLISTGVIRAMSSQVRKVCSNTFNIIAK